MGLAEETDAFSWAWNVHSPTPSSLRTPWQLDTQNPEDRPFLSPLAGLGRQISQPLLECRHPSAMPQPCSSSQSPCSALGVSFNFLGNGIGAADWDDKTGFPSSWLPGSFGSVGAVCEGRRTSQVFGGRQTQVRMVVAWCNYLSFLSLCILISKMRTTLPISQESQQY